MTGRFTVRRIQPGRRRQPLPWRGWRTVTSEGSAALATRYLTRVTWGCAAILPAGHVESHLCCFSQVLSSISSTPWLTHQIKDVSLVSRTLSHCQFDSISIESPVRIPLPVAKGSIALTTTVYTPPWGKASDPAEITALIPMSVSNRGVSSGCRWCRRLMPPSYAVVAASTFRTKARLHPLRRLLAQSPSPRL